MASMPNLIKDKKWKEKFLVIFSDYMIRTKKVTMELEEFDILLRTFITQQVNRFWYYSNEFEDLGRALYFPGNLLNHSCEPNCFDFFHG